LSLFSLFSILGFSFIPTEIWEIIFSKISLIRLLRTSTVCKDWKKTFPNSVISINFGELGYYWNKDCLSRGMFSFQVFNMIWESFRNLTFLEFNYSVSDPQYRKGYVKELGNYDEVLQRLSPQIRKLSLSGSVQSLTDASIMNLTNLEYLYLDNESNITDNGISKLINLNTLCLGQLSRFPNKTISAKLQIMVFLNITVV
jgi:hypothetical protein